MLLIQALLTLVAATQDPVYPNYQALVATVCAEAGSNHLTSIERRAVAATIRNRAERSGQPIYYVTTRRKQFAKPCRPAQIQLNHHIDAALGYLGFQLPPWWSHNVTHFVAGYALHRVEARWQRSKLRLQPKHPGLVHRFWKSPRR